MLNSVNSTALTSFAVVEEILTSPPAEPYSNAFPAVLTLSASPPEP